MKANGKQIKLPDQKLFEFDPDFFKGVENIEKFTDGGTEYEGQMKNGKFEGKARVHYDNGDIYEGEFKEDCKHGKGIYKFINGDIYNGNWNKDEREGWGVMKLSTSYYEGEWKANEINGKGK